MMPPVICDTGTGMIKAGFAGEQEPSLVIPNLVGRPILRFDAGLCRSQQMRDVVVGEGANNGRATLQLSSPLQNGIVQNWEDMEDVWDHTFAQLGVTPSEHNVVQTEATQNPPRNRER